VDAPLDDGRRTRVEILEEPTRSVDAVRSFLPRGCAGGIGPFG
jgi:hypothetical protein